MGQLFHVHVDGRHHVLLCSLVVGECAAEAVVLPGVGSNGGIDVGIGEVVILRHGLVDTVHGF